MSSAYMFRKLRTIRLAPTSRPSQDWTSQATWAASQTSDTVARAARMRRSDSAISCACARLAACGGRRPAITFACRVGDDSTRTPLFR